MGHHLRQLGGYQPDALGRLSMSYQPQQSGSYQPQASVYQSMDYQPSMAIPQQSYYYLPQMSICLTIYQPQQLSVQQPMAESPIIQYLIVQQLQPDSCQPIMQQLGPIIYQRNIAEVDDQSELLKSKVLTFEMTKESGVDDPRVKILADEFKK